jgi:type II secretory pathway predicted ATPase ExeA
MTFDPFTSSGPFSFESDDYKNCASRLNYLLSQKGFGLFTGPPGYGKTFSLRSFISGLNKNLYKVSYSAMSTLTTRDFYRGLAYSLDLEPVNKKIDLFRQIQERVIALSKEKRVTPIFVFDECQYFSTAILNDLKLIFNFDMDSIRPAVVIIAGLPSLNNTLLKHVHEALAQRIIVNYRFCGLNRNEAESYILNALRAASASADIFQPPAIEALFASCDGSIRKLNARILLCLLLMSV